MCTRSCAVGSSHSFKSHCLRYIFLGKHSGTTTSVRRLCLLSASQSPPALSSFEACIYYYLLLLLSSPRTASPTKQIHPAGKWLLKIESEAWEEIQWVQDKSWSFLFAESPMMSMLRDDDDDDDEDDDGGKGKPSRSRHRRMLTSDHSPRTPPSHTRNMRTKTRSRIFSGESRRQTDYPLDDGADDEVGTCMPVYDAKILAEP